MKRQSAKMRARWVLALSCLAVAGVHAMVCAEEAGAGVASGSAQAADKVRPGSGTMFDGVAEKYDLLNKLISLGLDQHWRGTMVRAVGDHVALTAAFDAPKKLRVLDVATGTADVAIIIAKMFPSAEITGVDPSSNMLSLGRMKIAEANLSSRIQLQLGESENLAFPDQSFDAAFVSFGVRNFADREVGLRELHRVLKAKPHATLAILEVSAFPSDSRLAPLARFFTESVVPVLGRIVSGHPDEYIYLQESMAAFPDTETFTTILNACGFELIFHKRLAPFKLGPNLYLARPAARNEFKRDTSEASQGVGVHKSAADNEREL